MSVMQTVACAVDRSGEMDKVVRYAADLARELGATLTLVHVAPVSGEPLFAPPPARPHAPDRALDRLSDLASDLRGERVHVEVLTSADVAEELIKYAQRTNCKSLIVGSHAKGRLSYSMASMIGRLLAGAPCPVLVVPAGKGEDFGPDFAGQIA